MKGKLILSVSLIAFLAGCSSVKQTEYLNEANKTKGILKNITEDNHAFASSHKAEDFKAIFNGQTPRAVVVGCSDSRFQIQTSVDFTPVNDNFVIRNIGNQYSENRGSIMYAVKHLKTPVVLIVGHDGCGAVTAVTQGTAELETPIRQELKNLKVSIHKKSPTDSDILKNVEENVHNQVKAVLKDFKKEVKAKKVDVLGAVYDFKNLYGQGYGALVFIDWNGEKGSQKIQEKAKSLELDKIKISN